MRALWIFDADAQTVVKQWLNEYEMSPLCLSDTRTNIIICNK